MQTFLCRHVKIQGMLFAIQRSAQGGRCVGGYWRGDGSGAATGRSWREKRIDAVKAAVSQVACYTWVARNA
eukprot:363504-Chlamydomonas_euryale.AAC.5